LFFFLYYLILSYDKNRISTTTKMGLCGSKMTDEQKRGVEANRKVEQELARRQKEMSKEVKILLLGTGASGKSTVAKQMQIIYLQGWGEREKEEFKPVILANIVENMQNIIHGVE